MTLKLYDDVINIIIIYIIIILVKRSDTYAWSNIDKLLKVLNK